MVLVSELLSITLNMSLAYVLLKVFAFSIIFCYLFNTAMMEKWSLKIHSSSIQVSSSRYSPGCGWNAEL